MPLAHLLIPQIQAKAKQIEADLGYTPTGYLQTVGFEKTPGDPHGLLDKAEPEQYDPNNANQGGGVQRAMGTFQRSNDQLQRAFAQGFMRQEGGLQAKSNLIPNAPSTAPTPAPVAKNKRGQVIIPAGTLGMSESGQTVDHKGRKLGYLQTPTVAAPGGGSIPLRTGERRYNDVLMAPLAKPGKKQHTYLEQTDPFVGTALEQKYGKHLRQSDVDQYGMPNLKFSDGYFKGKSKAEREDILNGVKALAEYQRGMRV